MVLLQHNHELTLTQLIFSLPARLMCSVYSRPMYAKRVSDTTLNALMYLTYMINRTCCIWSNISVPPMSSVCICCMCTYTDREIENSRVLASSKFAISCLLKMSFSLCFNGYTNYIAINKSTWKFNSFSFVNWFSLSVHRINSLCSAEVKGFTGFPFWKKKTTPVHVWNTVNGIWQSDTRTISYVSEIKTN